jgi:hypothetical protein
MGGVFFYSPTLRGGNTVRRKEGEREVTARHGGRATGVHAHIARCSSDIAVAAALCGGDAEGVCSYVVGSGELARGWHWTGPRDKRACASTPCLRGVRLGSWRARRGHMQCQQGRRKQRRCVGPCRWVLGVGITAASSDADQHRWLSGEVTPQCINARDDSTGQQGV